MDEDTQDSARKLMSNQNLPYYHPDYYERPFDNWFSRLANSQKELEIATYYKTEIDSLDFRKYAEIEYKRLGESARFHSICQPFVSDVEEFKEIWLAHDIKEINRKRNARNEDPIEPSQWFRKNHGVSADTWQLMCAYRDKFETKSGFELYLNTLPDFQRVAALFDRKETLVSMLDGQTEPPVNAEKLKKLLFIQLIGKCFLYKKCPEAYAIHFETFGILRANKPSSSTIKAATKLKSLLHEDRILDPQLNSKLDNLIDGSLPVFSRQNPYEDFSRPATDFDRVSINQAISALCFLFSLEDVKFCHDTLKSFPAPLLAQILSLVTNEVPPEDRSLKRTLRTIEDRYNEGRSLFGMGEL